MITRAIWVTAVGLVASFIGGSAWAQESNAIEVVRLRTQAVNLRESDSLKMVEEERGEVVELNAPPAKELHFRATVSMNIEHQSNAVLDPDRNIDDWVFLPAVEIGYNQPLGHGFSLDISGRADFAIYQRHNEFTYWGPSGTLLVDYRPRPDLPRAYVGGQLYRYDLFNPSQEITEAGALIAGVDNTWSFQDGKTLLSAGYQFARYWASPNYDDRSTHALFATVTRQLWGSLYAQASYSWLYTSFAGQDRGDSRHTVSLGLIYAFTNDIYLRLYASYLRNESSNPFADYENFTTGIGSSITLRF